MFVPNLVLSAKFAGSVYILCIRASANTTVGTLRVVKTVFGMSVNSLTFYLCYPVVASIVLQQEHLRDGSFCCFFHAMLVQGIDHFADSITPVVQEHR